MSRNGSYIVCSNCGRTAYKKRKLNEKELTFSESVGLIGISGLVWLVSKCRITEKKTPRFSIKRFLRNIGYLFLSFLLYLLGIDLIVNGLENESMMSGNSIVMVLSGIMVIWGGILVSVLKNKEYRSLINILGGVAANIICKVLGLFLIFADVECIDRLGFVTRIVVGVFFLVISRKVYAVIRDI